MSASSFHHPACNNSYGLDIMRVLMLPDVRRPEQRTLLLETTSDAKCAAVFNATTTDIQRGGAATGRACFVETYAWLVLRGSEIVYTSLRKADSDAFMARFGPECGLSAVRVVYRPSSRHMPVRDSPVCIFQVRFGTADGRARDYSELMYNASHLKVGDLTAWFVSTMKNNMPSTTVSARLYTFPFMRTLQPHTVAGAPHVTTHVVPIVLPFVEDRSQPDATLDSLSLDDMLATEKAATHALHLLNTSTPASGKDYSIFVTGDNTAFVPVTVPQLMPYPTRPLLDHVEPPSPLSAAAPRVPFHASMLV